MDDGIAIPVLKNIRTANPIIEAAEINGKIKFDGLNFFSLADLTLTDTVVVMHETKHIIIANISMVL